MLDRSLFVYPHCGTPTGPVAILWPAPRQAGKCRQGSKQVSDQWTTLARAEKDMANLRQIVRRPSPFVHTRPGPPPLFVLQTLVLREHRAHLTGDYSVRLDTTKLAVRTGLSQVWFGITPAHVAPGMVGVSLRDPSSVFMGMHVGQGRSRPWQVSTL